MWPAATPGRGSGIAAVEAAAAARVEDRAADAADQHRLGDDSSPRSTASKRASARVRLALLDRAALGAPFGEAAVEDRDAVGAVMAQHEPAARRAAQRAVVIDDDAVVAADPERHHRRAERRRAGQHVRRGIGVVGQRLDVEAARAGDVGRVKFGGGVARLAGHEQGRVEDREVGAAELLREPCGRDEIVHCSIPCRGTTATPWSGTHSPAGGAPTARRRRSGCRRADTSSRRCAASCGFISSTSRWPMPTVTSSWKPQWLRKLPR